MAMENEELLEALRHIIKEETQAAVKEEVRTVVKEEVRTIVKEEIQPINNRLDKLETDMADMKTDMKNMKNDMQNMKNDMQNMKNDMQNMKSDISNLKERATQREVNLENNINKNIQLLKEGHCDLVREIKDIKKDTSRIANIETELFATREITKNNVQSIKKLQSKRKI